MRTPPDILDPGHYKGVFRPALEAETLPSWCYTSPEWYALEVERIFKRSWNMAGHESRIPDPGDYFTFDLVGIPLVVARDRGGRIGAYANSCRHRGTLLLDGEGNCKGGIKCPYHGWVYGADGRLTGAPGMDGARDFDRARWGLRPVRLESWGGFLFVTLDPASGPLADWLGDLCPRMAPYETETLVVARRKSYDLRCNWKLYVENFKDVSHTKTVHKNTLYKMEMNYSGPLEIVSGAGQCHGVFVPHEGTRMVMGGVGGGVEGFPPRPAFAEGRTPAGSFYPFIPPLTCMGLCVDSAWFLEMYPKGPDRMTLVVNSCFYKDTIARDDFAAVSDLYYKRMDIAVPEDNEANENTQAGLASPHAVPGRMGHLEQTVSHCHKYWADLVLGRTPNPRIKGRVRAA